MTRLQYHSPDSCQNFSESQFAERETRNAHCHPSVWTPERWTEDVPLHWTGAWSITNEGPCFVPAALAFYGTPFGVDRKFCLADSNGSACGPTLAHAIMEGILEVIERDAAAAWWYNRLEYSGIEPEASNDRWITAMKVFHDSLGRRLHLVHLRTDFEIPVFAAISNTLGPFKPIIGLGCHFEPLVAARRAVAEVNQKLPVALRAFDFPSSDPAELLWGDRIKEITESLLCPSSWEEMDLFWEETYKGLTFRGIVEKLASRAKSLGVDVTVVDQSRPDTGIAVAKVFMPGTRPIWPRFGPGRLYDLPVWLGVRTHPTLESNLLGIPLLM